MAELKDAARRRFNRNNKIALSFGIAWAKFAGFSYLADPSPKDLLEGPEGCLAIQNAVGSNKLFDALGLLVLGPWGDALEEEFVLSRLPPTSYHLTVMDAVNVDNVHLLHTQPSIAFKRFFHDLPGSISSLSTSILRLPASIPLNASIRFKFASLCIWNRSALVARVKVADNASRLAISAIERRRSELACEWEQAWGLPSPEHRGWRPHISLGYFPNSELVTVSQARLAMWSEHFDSSLGGATFEFSSISPYAFTDMATFMKSGAK